MLNFFAKTTTIMQFWQAGSGHGKKQSVLYIVNGFEVSLKVFLKPFALSKVHLISTLIIHYVNVDLLNFYANNLYKNCSQSFSFVNVVISLRHI